MYINLKLGNAVNAVNYEKPWSDIHRNTFGKFYFPNNIF